MCRRNVRSTLSRSPFRSRPVSTKMAVSWSPMASCTSAAATDESTPPESPTITSSSPTRSRIWATCSCTNEPGVQDGSQSQTRNRKLERISSPRGVCATSGWNWTP